MSRRSAGFLSLLLIVASGVWCQEKQDSLAIVEAGIERSEDAPYVSKTFEFLPGESLYFIFHVTGFRAILNEKTETKSLHLEYEVTPLDEHQVPLTAPAKGDVTGEVGREDKDWVPKRRASFQLPSYVAAGTYHLHVRVKDLIAGTEAARDFTFQIGGIHVEAVHAIEAKSFEFLRSPDDAGPLDVPAYAPGDTVFARFEMMGFQHEAGNSYQLSYGIKVLRPDGKTFLDVPQAAEIADGSFYPAPYVPGDLEITTPKNASRGAYRLTLTVHDLVSKQTFDLKRSFTLE